MIKLQDIVNFCDEFTQCRSIADFEGAYNGLQVENNGHVSKIGAAVDAGLKTFEQAALHKIDFLIVHHGLFWDGIQPITGRFYKNVQLLIQSNCAVYSSHLPLDAHKKIGNNALIANHLNLEIVGDFLPYQGTQIGIITKNTQSRKNLLNQLKSLFPRTIGIEYGMEVPQKIGICSGSGTDAMYHLKQAGADTLITGELKQKAYNYAQEEGLNIYACGHYATETFGVNALGKLLSEKFQLPYIFLDSDCPL